MRDGRNRAPAAAFPRRLPCLRRTGARHVMPLWNVEADAREDKLQEHLSWWRSEKNSASLFRALAEAERSPRDAKLYASIAASEDAHAEFWAERIRKRGGTLPDFRPSLRTRLLIAFARRVDPALVVGTIARAEAHEASSYDRLEASGGEQLALEERAQAERLHLHAQTDAEEFAKKLILLFRRWVILIVGATLFGTAVALGRNVQIEGLFFGLLTGALTGAVVHYLLAKTLIPLPLGRIWCGWACWTAAVLDQLPFRASRGWPDGNATRWRLAAFAASLILVAGLVAAGYAGGLYGSSGVMWFVGGNVAYWALGIVLAFRYEDNRAFCKVACPVSVLLRLTSRTALLKVAGDPGACEACPAQPCRNLCPMDIDIPAYVQRGERVRSSECILCQHCVAVCPPNALKLSAGLDVSVVDRLQALEPRGIDPTLRRARGGEEERTWSAPGDTPRDPPAPPNAS